MKKHLLLLIFCISFYSTIFGQQTLGLFQNDSLALNGYTLIAPDYTTTYLIDNCGYVVNSWDADQRPGSSVYLLENGNLLRTGFINGTFNAGGSGGRIELFSWEGDLLWRYDYASPVFHQHHDVAAMSNGNILLIAWDYYTSQNAISNGRDPALTSNQGVWSEEVVELEPVGTDDANVVWRWRLWDHLIQDFDSTKANYGVVADHPELMNINYEANAGGGASSGSDWIHFNSINYNEDLDQIVVNSRHLNEFYIIDHSTTTEEAATHSGGNSGKGGDILYRWGNPDAYDRGGSADQKLFGQHDVQWIASGFLDEGGIMIFNNGWGRPDGAYSSVEIIEPPLQADGNYTIDDGMPYGPVDPFYIYTGDPVESFFSLNISGAQRLQNGNTLICHGRRGRLFEVTPDNMIVWDYQNPVRGNQGPLSQETDIFNMPTTLFRAYKYAADYPAFDGRDLTPGDPIELNPIAYDCTIFNGFTSLEEHTLKNVRLLENPVFNSLRIENETNEKLFVEVFDLSGKPMLTFFSNDFMVEKEVEFFAPGFYFVRISNQKTNQFYSQKFIKL